MNRYGMQCIFSGVCVFFLALSNCALASVIEGNDDWLFLEPELRHLQVGPFWGAYAEAVGRASDPSHRDPMPAILDFHKELEELGITLLVVPVPPKAFVYADYLPADLREKVTDAHLQQFYQKLREAGVAVLDLTEILRHPPDEERPTYCLTDTHWSGVGCVLAATAIAEKISPNIEGGVDVSFAYDWREIAISGDLQRMLAADDVQEETLPVRSIAGDTTTQESPVLVLGDSHTLVFHAGGDMHYRGAGLVDQLAYALGMPVDLIGVRGSGATPARINLFRRVRQNQNFWDEKRVVVWVFAAREFTESDGWRIVPVRAPSR